MTRVRNVVGRSIIVSIYDVLPGDVMYVLGNEADPIVSRIEHEEESVRFHYKPRTNNPIEHTIWMDCQNGGFVLIHDLKNERAEFPSHQEH